MNRLEFLETGEEGVIIHEISRTKEAICTRLAHFFIFDMNEEMVEVFVTYRVMILPDDEEELMKVDGVSKEPHPLINDEESDGYEILGDYADTDFAIIVVAAQFLAMGANFGIGEIEIEPLPDD
jgi:hypothetical protein